MTMQYSAHPDDERLAALAGGDPEAAGDGRLAEHAGACDRCAGLVAELRLVRASLAELPDLRPSRPLQLLPPVPAPRVSAGDAFGWLRRLAAPAMTAGAGLALVGAVGLGSVALGGMAAGGAATPGELSEDGGRNYQGAESQRSEAPATVDTLSAQPVPTSAAEEAPPDDGDESIAVNTGLDAPGPWLAILTSGLGLLVAGLVLRFAVQPRAG
jgi:anti-sigma factor RsiW